MNSKKIRGGERSGEGENRVKREGHQQEFKVQSYKERNKGEKGRKM